MRFTLGTLSTLRIIVVCLNHLRLHRFDCTISHCSTALEFIGILLSGNPYDTIVVCTPDAFNELHFWLGANEVDMVYVFYHDGKKYLWETTLSPEKYKIVVTESELMRHLSMRSMFVMFREMVAHKEQKNNGVARTLANDSRQMLQLAGAFE